MKPCMLTCCLESTWVISGLRQAVGAQANYCEWSILGARNPPLAHQALSTDLEVGLLLPCNVILYEEGGGSVVAILNQLPVLGVLNNPDLDSVALVVWDRLQRVVGALRE